MKNGGLLPPSCCTKQTSLPPFEKQLIQPSTIVHVLHLEVVELVEVEEL